jgi:hypothetical protein
MRYTVRRKRNRDGGLNGGLYIGPYLLGKYMYGLIFINSFIVFVIFYVNSIRKVTSLKLFLLFLFLHSPPYFRYNKLASISYSQNKSIDRKMAYRLEEMPQSNC